jgi:murein DD-endopeptidase MepM/ murein hydrolase activator NlpD
VGDQPLESAYTEAYKTPPAKSNCVFTVSPRAMALFTTPFFFPNIKPGNGFDFARAPYGRVDLTQYGTGTATAAVVVNHKGKDLSGRPGIIDDHPGHDWGLPKGTLLRAVGDGTVIRAGKYFKSSDNCNKYEADVYIRHAACGKNGYCEQFISYYTHMDEVVVFQGQSVKRGALIGTSGDSGCVPAHLHFSVARLTNTVHNLLETVTFKNDGPAIVFGKVLKGKDGKIVMKNVRSENLYNWLIDPYGWDAPYIDPWGSLSYGSGLGAMSIKLWRPGEAPPVGDW